VAEDRAWTCEQLVEQSGRLAAGLVGRGVTVGDRVALHLYNTPDAVLALLACLRIGAVAVPLNIRLRTPELHDLVDRTGPVLYLGERDLYPQFAPVPESLVPTDARFVANQPGTATRNAGWPDLLDDSFVQEIEPEPDAPALLLSTSGTSGESKIVIWSHRILADLHLSAVGRGIGRGDVIPLLTPLMHGAGVYYLSNTLTQHATAVLIHPFEPGAVLDAMQRHRVTTLFSLPFMCSELAREQRVRPRDVSALLSATVSGDACPAEVEADFGLGQRVGALVVLTADASRPSIHDVVSWLGERLAAYKVPVRIRAVEAIPRNALTKIDRAAVRREIIRLAVLPDDVSS
jgi:long-chain acyl-CoA synthetase